jgi:hypothetical protein
MLNRKLILQQAHADLADAHDTRAPRFDHAPDHDLAMFNLVASIAASLEVIAATLAEKDVAPRDRAYE